MPLSYLFYSTTKHLKIQNKNKKNRDDFQSFYFFTKTIIAKTLNDQITGKSEKRGTWDSPTNYFL